MTPNDVYALTGVADPRLDPTGRTVAYHVWTIDEEESEYRGAIWTAAVDGSTPPRRFTSGETRDGSPRWSPDGKWIAFTSKRGEDDAAQLYVIPADGGEPRKLTDLKEGPEDIAWSPDSTRIAFASRVRDEAYEEEEERKRKPRRITRLFYKLDNVGWTTDRRTHLFVVPIDGTEEAKQITDGDCEDGSPAWSPDGKRLVFSALRDENWDRELVEGLYLVGADGGEPERITPPDGSYGSPAWSPDGARIAYHFGLEDGTYPHHGQIGVLDVATRERRVLTQSLDRQCTPYPDSREPIWDGDRIVFGVEERGDVHLYAVAADGSGAPEPLLADAAIAGWDAVAGTIVYAASTLTTLRELHRDGKALTDVGKSFLTGRDLAPAERFAATSKDGSEVDAWVVRPVGFREGERYPTLLSIHGGPFTQYGNGFFDEFQVYAGAGYAVLYANPRGSSGYTEAWGRAIRGPISDAGPGWGTVDYEDLMAVVDTALERFDFVDPDRLGVLGGSYGGFMTTWIVGHTNRFKAAISERAVNQFISAAGSSDLFWIFERQFGGAFYDHLEEWLRGSPATFGRDIETPLLIMHSENDLRCNVEQGEHLFTMLRLLGKEVEFVRFPGESHELSRSGSPAHRVMRFEAILEWFDRYLK